MNKIANDFRTSCAGRKRRKEHNWMGRRRAYLALYRKHGNRILKHVPSIRAALDRIEKEEK